MNQKEYLRFFANKPSSPQRVPVNGKVAFAMFPKEVKEKIRNRLAERDPVMMKAMKSTKFGIKINGIEVGRDNIHEFEIPKMGAMKAKPKEIKEKLEAKSEAKKFTSAALFKMNKSEQVEILKALGVNKVPRFEKSRVKKILELQ